MYVDSENGSLWNKPHLILSVSPDMLKKLLDPEREVRSLDKMSSGVSHCIHGNLFPNQKIYPSPNCESALISHLFNVIVISLSPVCNSKSSCVILFWSITEAPQGRSRSQKFLLGYCSSLQPGSHAHNLHQLLLQSVGCALHKGAPDGLHVVGTCLPLLRSFNIGERGSSSLGPGCMHFLWHNFLISHPGVY